MTADIPELDSLAVIRRLAPLASSAEQGGCLVFDADGTLWTCDVGIDAFVDALEQRLFREEAREALLAEGRAHGVFDGEADGLDVNDIAVLLHQAYERGDYAERPATEMQVWAYAGWHEDELREHAREALNRHQHGMQIFQPLMPIIIWARDAGLRTIIVSASPKIVVEEAARSLGFAPEDIAAGVGRQANGRLEAALASPLPYGFDKVIAGREVVGASAWLATFGDSAFDVDMMKEALLPVAVRAKPELLSVLPEVQGAVRFTA